MTPNFFPIKTDCMFPNILKYYCSLQILNQMVTTNRYSVNNLVSLEVSKETELIILFLLGNRTFFLKFIYFLYYF